MFSKLQNAYGKLLQAYIFNPTQSLTVCPWTENKFELEFLSQFSSYLYYISNQNERQTRVNTKRSNKQQKIILNAIHKCCVPKIDLHSPQTTITPFFCRYVIKQQQWKFLKNK